MYHIIVIITLHMTKITPLTFYIWICQFYLYDNIPPHKNVRPERPKKAEKKEQTNTRSFCS